MNKKTLALIVALFLITCGLLYLALRVPPYQKPHVALTPTPTPLSVNAHTTLSITPASASQSSSLTQYTLAIAIDTGGNAVNSVQMELGYDPQALTSVTITPGSFFQQPSALVNSINTADGRISYALAEQISLPGKAGTGTLALLSFNLSPTYTGHTTTLTFLPKTAVAADKILESVLRKTNNYTLTIAPSTTPTAPLMQPLGSGSAH